MNQVAGENGINTRPLIFHRVMRVGLVYDLFEHYPWAPWEPSDADAENEPADTVQVIAEAIVELGYEPVSIGTANDLLRNLDRLDVDVVVNIAEGARSRNREGYVPTLLEMAGVPYLGSDALTLSLSLDKAWTKDLAGAVGVPSPPYRVYRSSADISEAGLPAPFPLFVKPRYEGSSKGIGPDSKVTTLEALHEQVDRIARAYRQDVLVESFIEGGGEFTVCVVGNDPPEVLPVLQRAVEVSTRIGLHALEHRGVREENWEYELEGELTPHLEEELREFTLRIFRKLECKDFARADFRVSASGQIWFLEINPLPTFAPDGTFAVVAELMGLPYSTFLAGVLKRGFDRLGLG